MGYTWIACEMTTGHVIADLPGLDCQAVSAQLGKYMSATATLPIPTAPTNWMRATETGASVLVCVDISQDALGNTTRNTPIWGGFVTHRARTDADSVDVSLATMEAYFDRRYVGDQTYNQVAPEAIMADLAAKYLSVGSNGGIPLVVSIQAPTGLLVNRTYHDIDDKTVYSVFQELAGIIGGPEWTVQWQWSTDLSALVPVLVISGRIGNAVPAGLQPAATFDFPGPVLTPTYDEDYTTNSGANDVMATSSASSNTRPQSPHIVTPDPDRPTFEVRFTPSTSITDVATLTAHATAKATTLFGGTEAVTMIAVTSAAPRLGLDWFPGDDVGYVLGGTDANGHPLASAYGTGISGIARTVGFTLSFASDQTPETIGPTMQDVSD